MRTREQGAELTSGLESREYGGREFGLRDPEGNLWSVGEYDPSPSDAQAAREDAEDGLVVRADVVAVDLHGHGPVVGGAHAQPVEPVERAHPPVRFHVGVAESRRKPIVGTSSALARVSTTADRSPELSWAPAEADGRRRKYVYGCAFWTKTLTPRVSAPPASATTRGASITYCSRNAATADWA